MQSSSSADSAGRRGHIGESSDPSALAIACQRIEEREKTGIGTRSPKQLHMLGQSVRAGEATEGGSRTDDDHTPVSIILFFKYPNLQFYVSFVS
jgi:hypothetical protein